MMAAPVGVVADVGYACYALQFVGRHKGEELLPHRGEICEMDALSEIFLRNLQLRHKRCLLYLVEHRSIRLTRLEVERTVLCLKDYIVAEESVLALELSDSLLHTILALVLVAIHETAPHHDAAVGFQRVGKHIGTIGVCAVIIAGAGLSLGVCLHEEATEIRNNGINLLCLVLPPLRYLRVKRVCRLESAQCHRCGEVHRKVGPDSIRA